MYTVYTYKFMVLANPRLIRRFCIYILHIYMAYTYKYTVLANPRLIRRIRIYHALNTLNVLNDRMTHPRR